MKLEKIDGKWYLKDMAFTVGTARPHAYGWIVSGKREGESGTFETWAKTEKQAKFLLQKHTGYLR